MLTHMEAKDMAYVFLETAYLIPDQRSGKMIFKTKCKSMNLKTPKRTKSCKNLKLKTKNKSNHLIQNSKCRKKADYYRKKEVHFLIR